MRGWRIERHATSKIRRADDLAAIRTLGFRGEALPSIASVSHFVLRTRARGQQSGTEIRVNGGTVASVTEVGAAEGTVVEVDDLFYNLPARRKFLKSDGAESAQVSRIVTQLALAYPEVGFTLTSAGRTLLQCPPAASLGDRLYQIYGERDDLIEVGKSAGGLRLTGYIAALAAARTTGQSDGGPTRGAAAHLHQPAHRQGQDDRARDSRRVQRRVDQGTQPRSAPLPRDAARSASTSTSIRRRPRSASANSRWFTRLCGVALMEALGQPGPPQLQLRPEIAPFADPVAAAIPGILAGGVYPNRWMPQTPSNATPSDVVSGFSRTVLEPSAPASSAAISPAAFADAQAREAGHYVRPLIPLGSSATPSSSP